MFNLRSFLFRGASAPADVPDDVRSALSAWRELPEPGLHEAHFHCRYVVVDVTTSGNQPDRDQILAVSAVGITSGGSIVPEDVLYLDFSGQDNDVATVDRKLMAFLQFAGKQPIVSYHSPFAMAFLQRAFEERLGCEFEPLSLDLAWLLPSLFEDISPKPMPLDEWLHCFEMISEGRRASMANALMLARLFQRLLVRAVDKHITTPAALLDESNASSFLRRAH